MKQHIKSSLSTLAIFFLGILIGSHAIKYAITGFPIFQAYHQSIYVVADTVQNLKTLKDIRDNNIDGAVETLEFDLDTDIITLHALQQQEDILTKENIENIKRKLIAAKKYRLKYPRKSKYKEIDDTVNEVLSQIQID